MPSACDSHNKTFEFTEKAVKASQERPQHIAAHICTELHYVASDKQMEEPLTGFNQNLHALGSTQAITSCQRVLEVTQVRTKGYTRSYQSYGTICQVGEQQLMMCDYPMVGKFTMTESFSIGTDTLADFILSNCPLGG